MWLAKLNENIWSSEELKQAALLVLEQNNIGGSTKPSPRLYPHQWFWDSCFIAIGLSNYNIEKSKTEIRSLVNGQWHNGMVPHIIFSSAKGYHYGPEKWRSFSYQESPENINTSCITQPPMLAEAVSRIGSKLNSKDRLKWYNEMYPHILNLHEWLYNERDPYQRGLICLIHPWESGMDNTPAWSELMLNFIPKYATALEKVNLKLLLNKLRKDTADSRAEERPTASELFAFYKLINKLQTKRFSMEKILKSKLPLVEDLAFNAITIRANKLLEVIASQIGQQIPKKLQAKFNRANLAFSELKDQSGNWYSRNARTLKPLEQPTCSQFLVLYSQAVSAEEAQLLADQIKYTNWWPKYGVATIPADSHVFKPKNYWQGPVWVNINWLIANGLKSYGNDALATKLNDNSIKLVSSAKTINEYYDPVSGEPAGTHNFSWSAALIIDLLTNG